MSNILGDDKRHQIVAMGQQVVAAAHGASDWRSPQVASGGAAERQGRNRLFGRGRVAAGGGSARPAPSNKGEQLRIGRPRALQPDGERVMKLATFAPVERGNDRLTNPAVEGFNDSPSAADRARTNRSVRSRVSHVVLRYFGGVWLLNELLSVLQPEPAG